MCLLGCHLPVELQVCLRANKKQNRLFMSIFPCLPDPAIEASKALLVVDAKSKKNAADALVEGSHDRPKGFLSGLHK